MVDILTKRQKDILSLANEYDRLVLCNGCRPDYLSDAIPDRIEKPLSSFFDLEFKKSCNNHDIIYNIGGIEDDRKRADKFFKNEMKTALIKSSEYNKVCYNKLKKTKWYQIKLSNIKNGFINIGKAIKKGVLNTPVLLKRQYLNLKVYEYYFLVRKLGKASFNFDKPYDSYTDLPSFEVSKNNKLRKEKVRTVLVGHRWFTLKEHESSIAFDRR